MQPQPGFVTLLRNFGAAEPYAYTPGPQDWVWHSLCRRSDAQAFFDKYIKPLFPEAVLIDRAKSYGITVQALDPSIGLWNAIDSSNPDAYMEEALGNLIDRQSQRQIPPDHPVGSSLRVLHFSGVAELYWGE